jgi:hypothetical protein
MKNINVSLFAILLCAFLRFLEQGDGNVFVLALSVGLSDYVHAYNILFSKLED